MADKILFVDDEEHVLSAYKRAYRKVFAMETAKSGAEGLEKLKSQGPFSVVVSDMQMPEMNGIEFLTAVQKNAPDSVRMMLTGNADQGTAMQAVNQGRVFQFLTKPCPPELFEQAIKNGIKQYHLITAEKELLHKTLNGSVKVLTDILSIKDPVCFGQFKELAKIVKEFARINKITPSWNLELATMFSQIGAVTLPPETLQKVNNKFHLTGEEQDLVTQIPEIGSKLLRNIPRLDTVAKIVLYQNKDFNGGGFPLDAIKAEEIPFGARALRIFNDIYASEKNGVNALIAIEKMKQADGLYDPKVLATVESFYRNNAPEVDRSCPSIPLSANDIRIGNILATDIQTKEGNLLIPKGTEITQMLSIKIKNFGKIGIIKEPIFIFEASASKELSPAT